MNTAASPPFATLLRQFRVAAGLTQEELAERANLSVRGVSDLERGLRTAPRRETVELLAEALDLTPSDRAELDAAVSRRRGPSPPVSRVSLPDEPNALIGREQDEARAVHLLRWEGVRLLTLTGPGGIGKTRLALRVARRMVEDFGDAVAFVSLAPIGDPALVPVSLAQSLGLREEGGRSTEESLISHLQSRQQLLVLDNFEHLLPAAPFLSRLLAGCPGLTTLVTSRAPLHLQLEQEMDVPSLVAPAPSSLLSSADAARSPAATLFVQRAQSVRPDYRLRDEEALTVAEICYRLDGLPLALELAAARIKLFPPHALLQRLARPLPLLTGGPADQPVRQQTLRNTIDWSYSVLSEEEQALFARLGAFAGGCTFDAAEVICNPDGQLNVLEGMASLLDKSLVRRVDGGEARFTMLETIRQYATEKLEERGEAEVIKNGHARFFLKLCEEAEPELIGLRQVEWLSRLHLELGNVRSILARLLDQGQIEDELRVAAALYDFWRMSGYWSEGLRWLHAGLGRGESVKVPVRAKALARAGTLASFRSEYRQATAELEEALVLARQIGDRRQIAWVLRHLGAVADRLGDSGRALELVGESLQIFRELGQAHGIALALVSLGAVAIVDDRASSAESYMREALSLFREVGDRSTVAITLNNLGYILVEQGEYTEARTCLEESVQLFRELGVRGDLAVALDSLGSALSAQGELERAAELLTESLAIGSELGDWYTVLFILGHMAELAVKQGKVARGARLAGAEATAREVMDISSTLPVEQEKLGRVMNRAREELGTDEFLRAWDGGRAMSVEETIAYALDQQRGD